MGPGHLIVLRECPAKLGDRFVKLATLQKRSAQAVMRSRKSLIFRQGSPVGRDRFVEFADSRVREPKVVVGIGIRTSTIRDCPIVRLDCFLDLALRIVSGAEPEIGFRELLRLLDRFLLRAD